MFGRHPSPELKTAAAWGARAIFNKSRDGWRVIDLLPDRQQMRGGDEVSRRELAAWINTVGLKKLGELTKRLSGSEATVVEYDDGPFHIEASPQSSYGYLYIGAWQRAPA